MPKIVVLILLTNTCCSGHEEAMNMRMRMIMAEACNDRKEKERDRHDDKDFHTSFEL